MLFYTIDSSINASVITALRRSASKQIGFLTEINGKRHRPNTSFVVSFTIKPHIFGFTLLIKIHSEKKREPCPKSLICRLFYADKGVFKNTFDFQRTWLSPGWWYAQSDIEKFKVIQIAIDNAEQNHTNVPLLRFVMFIVCPTLWDKLICSLNCRSTVPCLNY